MTLRKLQVTPADAGKCLDRFLDKALPGIDLSTIHVRIRGKAANAGRKLWGNEEVEVELPEARPVVAAPDAPEVPVLYQDTDLVVIDKPPGLVVESEGKGRSIVEIVGARVGGCESCGVAAPGVAHRLDRETTGCLALARSDDALIKLKAAFGAGQVDKRYLAIVLGEPPDTLRLEGPYTRDPNDRRRFTTRTPSARRAALSFTVRERLKGAALLEVVLETGRTHQIRVQAADAGFPVLADSLYGPDAVRQHPAAAAIGRHALHASKLRISGSPTLKGVDVEAPLPADFERALASLRA
ncbi:MAG TPA: RluA family pseudouridine synthase [Myxococcales bacterium]|jgi:23S rRNA pseudouridine1911/1915/1917 synthase